MKKTAKTNPTAAATESAPATAPAPEVAVVAPLAVTAFTVSAKAKPPLSKKELICALARRAHSKLMNEYNDAMAKFTVEKERVYKTIRDELMKQIVEGKVKFDILHWHSDKFNFSGDFTCDCKEYKDLMSKKPRPVPPYEQTLKRIKMSMESSGVQGDRVGNLLKNSEACSMLDKMLEQLRNVATQADKKDSIEV